VVINGGAKKSEPQSSKEFGVGLKFVLLGMGTFKVFVFDAEKGGGMRQRGAVKVMETKNLKFFKG